MKKPLLIEIGVEELPAIPFLKELPNIQERWQAILKEFSLEATFEFFYTPRRLVFWHREFPLKQADSKEQFYGAPIEIAYKDGKPTPAAIGFAKKCGVDISEISTSEKNSKEVLFFEKMVEGKESKQLLSIMIEKLLKSLQFGKSMRWGDEKEPFIRPIRWIGCMLDNQLVDMKLYGVESASMSFGHRTLSYAPFSYESSGDYFCKLDKAGVILYANEREKMIRAQFDSIMKRYGTQIEVDEALLAEVVAITEHPHALVGTFDEKFLTLPPEVIITSMKEHQRYFAVFKEGVLTNQFIVVSNAITEDYSEIVKGNEKVLHARLSDGLFFYENDLRNGLQREGLKNITFMQGAGTIYEKSIRESRVAAFLADRIGLKEKELLEKTVLLAKADLLTDMVYEFTELQGLMGYYYAKAAKEDARLALALKEQYLPDGEDSVLPSSDFSAVVALSVKIDSILTLFSIGKIPTGTKDPFALRRAAIGIIKIVLDRGFHFNIKEDFVALSEIYPKVDVAQVESFFLERMMQYFDVNTSILQAVLQTGERDIGEIAKKVEALDMITKEKEFKASVTTFKRVANIIKDMDIDAPIMIEESLLTQEAEKRLYQRFKEVEERVFENYHDKLQTLFALKPEIDSFFDSVMVNVEDEKIKRNRKNLILAIYLSFREVADIKEITI
jgi:glycyl-tRNA synthetase beta chain